jgi:hypothetical protein
VLPFWQYHIFFTSGINLNMQVLPEITAQTDQPFWLKRDDFRRFVHFQNYMCRDVQHVYLNAYLQDWFRPKGSAGILRFLLPTVYLKDGQIYFINGPHRTAVLFAHLDTLPMALATAAADDQELLFGCRLEPLRMLGSNGRSRAFTSRKRGGFA